MKAIAPERALEERAKGPKAKAMDTRTSVANVAVAVAVVTAVAARTAKAAKAGKVKAVRATRKPPNNGARTAILPDKARGRVFPGLLSCLHVGRTLLARIDADRGVTFALRRS